SARAQGVVGQRDRDATGRGTDAADRARAPEGSSLTSYSAAGPRADRAQGRLSRAVILSRAATEGPRRGVRDPGEACGAGNVLTAAPGGCGGAQRQFSETPDGRARGRRGLCADREGVHE